MHTLSGKHACASSRRLLFVFSSLPWPRDVSRATKWRESRHSRPVYYNVAERSLPSGRVGELFPTTLLHPDLKTRSHRVINETWPAQARLPPPWPHLAREIYEQRGNRVEEKLSSGTGEHTRPANSLFIPPAWFPTWFVSVTRDYSVPNAVLCSQDRSFKS